MSKEVSIISAAPEQQLAALKGSRLSMLIKDATTLHRIAEAAVMLLTNDKLRACDEESILGALYKAATLDFRLEPEFGECHLIPRSIKTGKKDEQGKDIWKSVCVFQVGYKGWKAKALQTGNVSFLSSRAVYKADQFSFEYGTSQHLKHIPADEKAAGSSTHFYALAKLVDGSVVFEVITKQEAEKSRRYSETQYDWIGTGANKIKQFSESPKGIWKDNYDAMALRVPIKKLCASLPLTPALEAANSADGVVTYLQKDGTVTTITAAEVEEAAATEEAAAIPIEKAETFVQIKDFLGSMSEFSEVLKYYQQFKEGEQAGDKIFVQLFFEAAAKTAKNKQDLNDFYNEAKDWQKSPDLVKILSNRKKEFEQK